MRWFGEYIILKLYFCFGYILKIRKFKNILGNWKIINLYNKISCLKEKINKIIDDLSF